MTSTTPSENRLTMLGSSTPSQNTSTERPALASMKNVRLPPTRSATVRRPWRQAVKLASAKNSVSTNASSWVITIQGFLTPIATATSSPR